MNQRAERRKKNERRTLPAVGDRRGSGEPVEVLDWSEPKTIDWSDAEQAPAVERHRVPGSANE